MLIEKSREIFPEAMKGQSQSRNNAQLWMSLMVKLKSEIVKKQLEKITISRKQYKNVMEFPKYFHRRKPDIIFVPIQDDNLLDINLSFDISYEKKDR